MHAAFGKGKRKTRMKEEERSIAVEFYQIS